MLSDEQREELVREIEGYIDQRLCYIDEDLIDEMDGAEARAAARSPGIKTPDCGKKEIGMPKLTYLSLGWGVQSWTIAAMVALRDLPPIDLAIHSDTGHEASGTYAHAEKWTPWLTEHGIQVVTVKPENNDVIREDWGKKSGSPSIQIPAFTLTHLSEDNAGGANAKEGQIGPGSAPEQWKITPIRKHLRSILGPRRLKPGSLVCWQGREPG